MTYMEQLFQTIRHLPVQERLRLVERVVHDLADGTSSPAPVGTEPSPIGLFADDPDEVDAVMKIVAENRRGWRPRGEEGDDEQGPA